MCCVLAFGPRRSARHGSHESGCATRALSGRRPDRQLERSRTTVSLSSLPGKQIDTALVRSDRAVAIVDTADRADRLRKLTARDGNLSQDRRMMGYLTTGKPDQWFSACTAAQQGSTFSFEYTHSTYPLYKKELQLSRVPLACATDTSLAENRKLSITCLF